MSEMSNLILLIQSEPDIAALPVAAESILAHGYKGCWILVSPAIAVNAAEASAKYDKEIADLRTAERAAAERGDYTAAAEHKLAREGKELERGTAIAGAWKAIDEKVRLEAIKMKLAPLFNVLNGKTNVKTQLMQDHYDPSQWIAMLNSLSGAWFKEFTPGSFSVAWPAAIPAIAQPVKIPIVQESLMQEAVRRQNNIEIKPPKPAKTKLVSATNPDERRAQLLGMRFFALQSAAKAVSVDSKGKKPPQIVDEILAKEFAPATA